ncbi:MAG TPA: energy transducer TonB [Burkholderiaceae bacterium]|nr:energy transducer TonB [Burkholderiaceae bacterium]
MTSISVFRPAARPVGGPGRLALIAGALLGFCAALQAQPSTYEAEVWLRAQFDTQGRLQSLEPQDEATQPAAVWSAIQARLAPARITPPQVEGQPAALRTGLRVSLEVLRASTEQAQSQVRIRSLQPSVLPLEMSWLGYPDDVRRTPGWDGAVTIRCKVNIGGQCGSVEVEALPGMPDSVRRWARQSAQAWRFEAQQLNGQPVAGDYSVKVNLHTKDELPKRFIGKDQRL